VVGAVEDESLPCGDHGRLSGFEQLPPAQALREALRIEELPPFAPGAEEATEPAA
jgi:hypothetical protein